MKKIDSKFLCPTAILDSDHPEIVAYAGRCTEELKEPVDKAVALYYAVRDGIWYNPYYPFHLPEHYRASKVLASGEGYCVSKASLLCALARAVRIPTRIGFAHVRNHLATRQLIELMGSDLFVYHGFTEFYLADRWVKATPAFNKELCTRHRVAPLEFNGYEDSIFHPFNSENKPYMEYVEDLGSYADVPVNVIVEGWKQAYGTDRVEKWIALHEKFGGLTGRDFFKEEVI